MGYGNYFFCIGVVEIVLINYGDGKGGGFGGVEICCYVWKCNGI